MSSDLFIASPPPRRGFFARFAKAAAKVPNGLRVYAVGDIHGCSGQLAQLLRAILEEPWHGDKYLIFLGDYCDRGPDTKGVIDRLLALRPGVRACFLKGNHDQTLLDFLDDPSVYRLWSGFGADQTLASYGVAPPESLDDCALRDARDRFAAALPPQHRRFLKNLSPSTRVGDYFFVHAGVRPGVALERQTDEDLLWIRDEFLMATAPFGAVVVHGHTPSEAPVRRANRIGVDTGAYLTGRLSAAVLEGDDCRFLFA